ncbi:amino acid ABC transporter permease [Actinomadura logoneensis]|uniref:Amino acid ABC transporter permease n=1 Tax=Actinomadura logoneensis TaxID=2293572 RepID=A0A372JCS0_9ACTN|nr:amino acid ABC transporter permease [Actinomadura logoneensis]RFU37626.1 amino acid ABC transporter permease [Actinomadura logoneensis]
MSRDEATVLFDAPGPRARRRNMILTVVSALAILGIIAYVIYALGDKGQFAKVKWEPFTKWDVWRTYFIQGTINTLKAAAVGTVLALLFGAVFGLARLSDHRWIRVPAAAVVEFFRAMPLLILIFLAFFVPATVSPIIADGPLGNFQRIMVENVFSIFGVTINNGTVTVPAFAAVVFGLTLYNGSVLAEVVRAGVQSIPRGQSEAAFALGMRKNAVMRLVLLPQAVTAMLPAIVSQIVVLLKDTSLGFIIGYEDLTSYGFKIEPANFSNLLQAAIVCAAIYITINLIVSRIATWLEARSRRSRKSIATMSGDMSALPGAGMGSGAVDAS